MKFNEYLTILESSDENKQTSKGETEYDNVEPVTKEEIIELLDAVNQDAYTDIASVIADYLDEIGVESEDDETNENSIKHQTASDKAKLKKYHRTAAYKKAQRTLAKKSCMPGFTYSLAKKKCTRIDRKKSKLAKKISKLKRY